jgi:hypothetical protein
MSPSRLAASRRQATDIWAFGAVLYEMFSGRPAAPGATVSETITAVLESEPDWTAMRASVPPNIRRLVRRCLEKDAKRRLKDIGDACLELDDALTPSGEKDAVADSKVSTSMPGRARLWSLVAVVALGAAVFFSWPDDAAQAPAAPRRLDAALGTDASLVTFQFGQESAVIPHATGSCWRSSLIRSKAPRASLCAPPRRVEGRRSRGPKAPQSVLFARRPMDCVFRRREVEKSADRWRRCGHDLRRPEQSGGCLGRGRPHHVLARSVRRTLVAGFLGGEQRPGPAHDPRRGRDHSTMAAGAAGGKAVLFTGNSRPDGFQEANVVVQSLPNGPRKVLVRGAYFGRYLASGHLVYMHNATVFAARFDLNRLELAGPAVPVLEGVAVNLPAGRQDRVFRRRNNRALPALVQSTTWTRPSIDGSSGTTDASRSETLANLRFAATAIVCICPVHGKQQDIWTATGLATGKLTFDDGDLAPCGRRTPAGLSSIYARRWPYQTCGSARRAGTPALTLRSRSPGSGTQRKDFAFTKPIATGTLSICASMGMRCRAGDPRNRPPS